MIKVFAFDLDGTLTQHKTPPDFLQYFGIMCVLPPERSENYVTKDIAKANGYRRKKNNLADVLPGYMIGGDEFLNNQAKLPLAPGRTWYEADIDYTYGKRNLKRVLYSNDGLVFVTEDHYQTFYEITR